MLLKKVSLILLITFGLSNCKSSKKIIVKKQQATKVITRQPQVSINPHEPIISSGTDMLSENKNGNNKALGVVDYAKQFYGVRYRFGGTTRDGMDCSGLVYESYRAHDIILPRISRDMAKQGSKISLENAQEGDLLFFKTFSRRNSISHVGLVVTNTNGDVAFIHASTSLGVIISKLSEKYWNNAFVEARRVL